MEPLTERDKTLIGAYTSGIANTVGKAVAFWLYLRKRQRKQARIAEDFAIAEPTVSREIREGNLSFTRFACLLVRDRPNLEQMPLQPTCITVFELGALTKLALQDREFKFPLPDEREDKRGRKEEEERRNAFGERECCYLLAMKPLITDLSNAWAAKHTKAIRTLTEKIGESAERRYCRFLDYVYGEDRPGSRPSFIGPDDLQQLREIWFEHVIEAVLALVRLEKLGRFRLDSNKD